MCARHRAKQTCPELQIQAVYALGEDAPKGEEPVDWRLLTTLPARDFEQAAEKVQWYDSDGTKINVAQIFKLLSPETEVTSLYERDGT